MDYCDRRQSRSNRSTGSNGFRRMVHSISSFLQDSGRGPSPRTILLLLLSLVIGGALSCQVIWQHVRATRMKVQINSLEQRNHELQMKIQETELEVARLERLDRIQRIAVTELGMEPLENVEELELSKTQWVQSPRKGANP